MKAYKVDIDGQILLVSKNVGKIKDVRNYIASYMKAVGEMRHYDQQKIKDLVEYADIQVLSQDDYDAIYGRVTVEHGIRIAVKKLVGFLRDHFW